MPGSRETAGFFFSCISDWCLVDLEYDKYSTKGHDGRTFRHNSTGSYNYWVMKHYLRIIAFYVCLEFYLTMWVKRIYAGWFHNFE